MPLDYDPRLLPRELRKYYISATPEDIEDMLREVGVSSLESLFEHIPSEILFNKDGPSLPPELGYLSLIDHLTALSQKNNTPTSFIGDGLQSYKTPEITPHVCSLRGLSTAYTPYQPERSQGTLGGLWAYSSALSMLTGFEAINASMYDRATCLYEAIVTSIRLTRRGANRALLLESLYPGDLEVVRTLAQGTDLEIQTVPLNPRTGVTDWEKFKASSQSARSSGIACLAFPQVNSLGNLEDVDALTDWAHALGAQAIAVSDPLLLSTGGLRPPIQFGKRGADILVGEGQHLATPPNFGGPGLGIFGIRTDKAHKNAIRSTPGRYVGKARDREGLEALTMILSTREQHIRREKATSNICSNQSFLAILVGASVLCRGEKGMIQSRETARRNALSLAGKLTRFEGVELAFPQTPFYNEVTFKLSVPAEKLIEDARAHHGLHLGVDVSPRVGDCRGEHLLVSFSDLHGPSELAELEGFFASRFTVGADASPFPSPSPPEIPSRLLRQTPVGLPDISLDVLKDFYTQLDRQNVGPENALYPLGSCTMKYNPYINDAMAALPGFTDLHPQAPLEDAQGSLQLLFEIQEMFKEITGLAGVTTQPVAGAQGELVGLKIIQAYHRDNRDNRERGEQERNLILIPRSAHGTNPATAAMANYEIVNVEANEKGQIQRGPLEDLIQRHPQRHRIAGIMITNPNTSGIFEEQFKEISDLIHREGGLVYMDGANMNAIAGHVNLAAMGVDIVHNNLHKTWSIPHGGGGPGDAIVAVCEALVDYLPGLQVRKEKEGNYHTTFRPRKSIGSVHRHWGNFAHKVRCYTYLRALGSRGIRHMSAVAVLSARYLYSKSSGLFPMLPAHLENVPRMHEFILSIDKEMFTNIQEAGIPKSQAMGKIGKLFLDFGLHPPTVAFPEVFGLMIEPTESFSKGELDRFVEVLQAIHHLIESSPEILTSVPHFTPVSKIDEVEANKALQTREILRECLPCVHPNKIPPETLASMPVGEICEEILKAHARALM